jgi:hypothetical protein
MKTLPAIVVTAAVVLTALLNVSVAVASSDGQKSFEQLKGLVGSWEGKDANGNPVEVDYRTTSMGSALMSEIKGMEKDNMITMFNLDGQRLLMIHYCATGNQPRMLASMSPDGKTISFEFLDATNLASPDAGHMQQVVISMLEANHHTEEWVFVDHGKVIKADFDLWRRK